MDSSRKSITNIDDYIAAFPADVQAILREMRRIVHDAAPQATEAMSYGMPTFKLKGNLVHFAAFKNHIGFYPTPPAIEAFEQQLSVYKTSKGAIQFPLDKPIPYDLVREMTEYRVKQVMRK